MLKNLENKSSYNAVVGAFEESTGLANVRMCIVPAITKRKETHRVEFFYAGGSDVMGVNLKRDIPVWDFYGNPSQIYKGKPELLGHLGSMICDMS
jgi:hypothetical protein